MVERFASEDDSFSLAQWQNLAGQVAAIIRDSGVDNFRQAVRQWAFKEVEAEEKRARREEERLEALKKDGVLYCDGSIPDKPKGDWFFHLETLRGSIKLPREIALHPEPPQRPEGLTELTKAASDSFVSTQEGTFFQTQPDEEWGEL